MVRVGYRTTALLLAFQLILVAGLGTGLHDLFGCSHGACCDSLCASSACAGSAHRSEAGCGCDSAFHRRRVAKQAAEAPAASRSTALPTTATSKGNQLTVVGKQDSSRAGLDACSICDLLEQFHVTNQPTPGSSGFVELVALLPFCLEQVEVCEAERLADSRGPPVVAQS